MDIRQIRNFSIIAHIDHGKSTLSDRMLEITSTVEKRKMQAQILDSMALERERGITIKMAPVRMLYKLDSIPFVLNLIDTPGHIDFSYEVSRALSAVEGALLLVDATQGVEAQTISTLDSAQSLGLVIIPVVNKIDAPLARTEESVRELSELLEVDQHNILRVSGKTGQAVEDLLSNVIKRIGSPRTGNDKGVRALIFDFAYSNHQGIILYTRIFDGTVKKGDKLKFCASNRQFEVLETGIFTPQMKATETLSAGEIGYIKTGIKEPGVVIVGDTLTGVSAPLSALPGYREPQAVVWASIFPESQNDYTALSQALSRLKLYDSALTFEGDYSSVLGRGYRCGFLGMLHLEIAVERLKREFGLVLIITSPSVVYEVEFKTGGRDRIYSPAQFPDNVKIQEVYEPWILVKIFSPPGFLGAVSKLLQGHEGFIENMETISDKRVTIEAKMPLRELMRNFFDELKSITSGYGSISYDLINELRKASVERLDVLIADERVEAFTKVVARNRIQEEAEKIVNKLHELMPRQMFVAKIQAFGLGRILASRTMPALRKDVTAKLYGGDVTRKRKLLEKQKKGKKKMGIIGRVSVPQDIFLKIVRGV
jgi:GTP-binding protein LepA